MPMAITHPAPDTELNARFTRMMRLGHVSYAEGNRRQAHRFWRRAAMIKPHEEQVWLALLNVVDSDADRRVCLQNIVIINPNNVRAVQQLNAYYEETQPAPLYMQPLPAAGLRPLYWLLRLVEIAFMGALLALGIIAIRYVPLG